jgi:hypothetical protein
MGFDYELEVEKGEVENTPMDASLYNYKLKNTISKIPNQTPFRIPIQYDEMTQFITSDTSGNFVLCNQLNFIFEQEELKLQWDSIQNMNTMQEATFIIDTTSFQLILKSF